MSNLLNLFLLTANFLSFLDHTDFSEKLKFGIFFLLGLGVMIIVHELGHYWAAVAVGIRVETFSVGFGPRLFGFRRGETDFRVSAIPLGGYVRMLGEHPGEETSLDPGSFQAKARWQRAIVIVAGPLMNIVLAVFILTAVFMNYFPDLSGPAIVTEIAPNSAAQEAGVQPGDRIVRIDSIDNPTWEDVSKKVLVNGNHAIDVVLLRNGQNVHASLTPRIDAKEGVGFAGWAADLNVEVGGVEPGSPAQHVGIKQGDIFVKINGRDVSSNKIVRDVISQSGGKPIDVQMRRGKQLIDFSVAPVQMDSVFRIGIKFSDVPTPTSFVKLSFPEAFVQSVRKNADNSVFLFQTLAGILERRVSPRALSGPVGVYNQTVESLKMGPLTYVQFMAFLSLNLAIFNLLPIPILDGGTLVLLLTEMLLQRDVSMAIKETVLKVGFVLLMMLVVFVIYSDLTKS